MGAPDPGYDPRMGGTLDWFGCATFRLRTRPDVAILAAAGRGNIDGEPIQGSLAEFLAREADSCRPRRIVLSHHDDWLPGFSIDTDVKPIREELARWVPDAELLELAYVDGTEILPLP